MNETKKTGLGFLGYKDPHNGRDPIGSLHIYKYHIYIYKYTNIYIWLIFIVNVGKYTSPMDPVGTITANLIGVVY